MVEATPMQFTPAGPHRNGKQHREKRADKPARADRPAKADKQPNDAAPAPLKFKISLDKNERGERRVVQMLEKCDFATLFAKAKQMCAENGVPESDCKLKYKNGRDLVICQDENDLELAIQSMDANKRYPKINFKIKKTVDSSDEESKERVPGHRAQTKKLISDELEKQCEAIMNNLNASEQQSAQDGEKRRPKAIIKQVVKGFAQSFKNNSRDAAASDNSTPLEAQVAEFMRNMQEQNPEEWAKTLNEVAQAKKDAAENKDELLNARAVIVRKPEGIINLSAGNTANVEIEVLNDTHWPWKYNCTLGLAKEQTEANLPIQVFHFPVQTNVMGKTQFTIRAPLCVAPNANIDPTKVYSVNLAFFEPAGKQFGQHFSVNVKQFACADPQTTNGDQHLQASNQVA